MNKVPPSERLNKELKEVLAGQVRQKDDLLDRIIETSVRMVLQRVLEQEVEDYLGRGYYERAAESRSGYRNGYEAKRVKSAEGEIALEVPQVRDSGETYRSEVVKAPEPVEPAAEAPGGGDVCPRAVDPRHRGDLSGAGDGSGVAE